MLVICLDPSVWPWYVMAKGWRTGVRGKSCEVFGSGGYDDGCLFVYGSVVVIVN